MSVAHNTSIATIQSVPKRAWECESPRPRRRSIVHEYASNTSTHGLFGIARGHSKHNRAFWAVAFIIVAGIMVYFITRTIINYFDYSTQISMSVVVEQPQIFPAVTVCNYSPIRSDYLYGPFFNYTNSRNLTNPNQPPVITPVLANILRQYLLEKLNNNQSIAEHFFSLGTLMISCAYNGIPCTVADFISFQSSDHGMCYTFNARSKDANMSAIRKTNANGGSGLLQIRLYAQSHLYVPFAAEDVLSGMVAMIHDNTELPLIDIAGIELAPGRKHKISYKKKTSYFLPAPYTDCTTEIPLAMQSLFDQYGGADYVYSQDVCHMICTQTYIYHQCGCVNPFQWSTRSVVLPGTSKVIQALLCNITDPCFVDATIRLSNETSLWEKFCGNCTQACSTIDFLVTPSSVAAPGYPYDFGAKAFVEATQVPLPANWSTDWETYVTNNYVGLDVVCQSTLVENFTQDPSMSAVDVLSNVGGQTGLWIGVSILSIMELLEMLYRLIRHECHVIGRKIRPKMKRSYIFLHEIHQYHLSK